VNGGGVPIARLFGIEIRIAPAWTVLVALVAVIGAQQATAAAPDLPPVAEWAVGVVVAVAFLASVVGHELAHALVGRRRGVPVTSIALGFLGGLAPLAIQGDRPRDEVAIALVGPGVSLGLGAIAIAIGSLLEALAPSTMPIADGLLVIGALNLLLCGFSLVPAMPLDGGRVVRGLAWAWSDDRDRAARITARIGRMAGWLIIGVGASLAVADFAPAGLLAIALGWLLTTSSRTVERRLELELMLRGMRVSDAMKGDVPWVGPNLTIDTFAARFEGPDAVAALPVVDDEQVVGVLGRRRLRRLGRRRFDRTRVEEIMAVPPQAPFLAPSDALWDAVELFNEGGLDGLAVALDGRLAGLVTRDGLADAIRARAASRAAKATGG
jgi:Zn-dependent protease/CBS domain-containing protein